MNLLLFVSLKVIEFLAILFIVYQSGYACAKIYYISNKKLTMPLNKMIRYIFYTFLMYLYVIIIIPSTIGYLFNLNWSEIKTLILNY